MVAETCPEDEWITPGESSRDGGGLVVEGTGVLWLALEGAAVLRVEPVEAERACEEVDLPPPQARKVALRSGSRTTATLRFIECWPW
jgi:hypothetical protein